MEPLFLKKNNDKSMQEVMQTNSVRANWACLFYCLENVWEQLIAHNHFKKIVTANCYW